MLVANLFVICGGLTIYVLAHRWMFTGGPSNRRVELIGCSVTGAIIVVAFAVAHAGMNRSLGGRAAITDFHWLWFSLIFAVALLCAHVGLRLQKSRADQVLLPVAALLVGLGLVNVYTWEVRDANAYISTAALPAAREFELTLETHPTLSADQKVSLLESLGQVPDELQTTDGGRRVATVLDDGWVGTYNAFARRVSSVLESNLLSAPEIPIREVDLYDTIQKHVLIASGALLLVPLLLAVLTPGRLRRWLQNERLVQAGALAMLFTCAWAAATSWGRQTPAVIGLGDSTFAAFEVLKIGVIVLLALALGHTLSETPAKRSAMTLLPAAACVIVVGTLLLLDPGIGVTLLAACGFLTSFVLSGRLRWSLIGVSLVLIMAAPFFISSFGDRLPQTVSVRIQMWTDPWGYYDQTEVRNQVLRSLHTIVANRSGDSETLVSAAAVSADETATLVQDDVGHLIQELQWRMDAVSADGATRFSPFIPATDWAEEQLLIEAERIWYALGGYDITKGSSSSEYRSLEARIARAVFDLEQEAALLDGVAASGAGGSLSPSPRTTGLAFQGPALQADNAQLQRGLFALRAGGLAGVGLGQGRPEAVPAVNEDLAIVAVGEKLGFLGAALTVFFILLIAVRGIDRAERETNPTYALLLIGLSGLFALQVLINVGGTIGLLPFTGITFPFVSRSGTSVVVNLAALALIMAVAQSEPQNRVDRKLKGWGEPARNHFGIALEGAGLPLAMAILLGVMGSIQLTGRTLLPGSMFERLPGPISASLHVGDQWASPSYGGVSAAIVDRSGEALARTDALEAARTYPDKDLATSLGHTLMQLDVSYADELRQGPEGEERPELQPPGFSLATTIDSGIQGDVHRAFTQGAIEAGLPDVESVRGAVIVIDVTTGEILALESRPLFSLEELSDAASWAAAEAKDRRAGFPQRFLNRAILGSYPPGSILKTITAAGVLEEGLHSLHSKDFDYRTGPQSAQPPDGLLQIGRWHELPLVDGEPITGGNHPHIDDWLFSLEEAFAWSCNIAFAQMGIELGASGLEAAARQFGFEQPLHVPGLGTSLSSLDNTPALETGSRYFSQTSSNLARTAFGQGQASVSPLQMALVSAAIANRGVAMQPHIVAGWQSADGSWIEKTEPVQLFSTGFGEDTLDALQDMMRASATYGWASGAKLNPENQRPGVAGKTGSAEWSEEIDAPHAWFMGYFPVEDPRIALAVIVERGVAGPSVAVRIAHQVFSSKSVERYLAENES